MEAQKFDFKQFYAVNDVATKVPLGAGAPRDDQEEDNDEVFWDLPPPPNLRRVWAAEAFPACRELMRWPHNYPVEGDADLDDTESEADDARIFVYSEIELDAWAGIVASVLQQSEWNDSDAVRVRPLPSSAEKRPSRYQASEATQMKLQQPSGQGPAQRWSIGGVTAAAWANSAPSGGRYYTVTIDRHYKTQQVWKRSRSLRLQDIPLAIAVLQKAVSELGLGRRDDPAGSQQPAAAAVAAPSEPTEVLVVSQPFLTR